MVRISPDVAGGRRKGKRKLNVFRENLHIFTSISSIRNQDVEIILLYSTGYFISHQVKKKQVVKCPFINCNVQ